MATILIRSDWFARRYHSEERSFVDIGVHSVNIPQLPRQYARHRRPAHGDRRGASAAFAHPRRAAGRGEIHTGADAGDGRRMRAPAARTVVDGTVAGFLLRRLP